MSPRTLTIHSSQPGQPWRVEWHASLDSTMTRASEIAAPGGPAGRVVVADFQTQGRGTRGRTWLAPPGSCLMFSVVLKPGPSPETLTRMPYEIACALCDALNKRLGIGASVKAPNDVTVGERKLAGILCQSHIRSGRVEWVVCGIGLNTNLAATDAGVPGATSLLIETGETCRHDELLANLLGALEPFRGPCHHGGALARPES